VSPEGSPAKRRPSAACRHTDTKGDNIKRTFLALFSLAFASLGWAQSGEQVAAPSFKPGDSWTYVQTDKFDRSWNAKYVVTIEWVSDSSHETAVQALEGTVSDRGGQFTSEMNPIVLGEQKYEPYIPVFSFPLTPGKKWGGTYSFLRSGRQWNVTRANRVEGWETVKTEAGDFKALKITYSEQRRAGRAANDFHGTSWYSPEVRRVVLLEFKASTPPLDRRVELVSFKLAQ
jgi:hypothetical protein